MDAYKIKTNIAIFIAILFHVCGFIGILFTPYKSWFIDNTFFNLCLMISLLISLQKSINVHFIFFLFVCIATGLLVEIIGVNTGKLFGNYSYGDLLGRKIKNVPIIIGLQWFMIIYCSGVITDTMQNWAEKKYSELDKPVTKRLQLLSLLIDGALCATLFDYIMEPVAVKMGLWSWAEPKIPFYNYACWFMISILLLLIFRILKFNKTNTFAIHLFIIQLLFFFALRIYL